MVVVSFHERTNTVIPVGMTQFEQSLHAAIVNLNQGNRQQATTLALKCVELEPRSADAHLVLGTCLDQGGHKHRAIEHFQAAVSLNPKHLKGHLNLGICCMGVQDFAGAASAFRQALSLEPQAPEIHHYLGCALASNQEHSAALPYFETALAASAGNARMLRDYGGALEKVSRFADAKQAYTDALKANPDYALVHQRLGHVYQVEGDFEASEQHLRKALALSQQFPEAYQMLSLMERLRAEDIAPIQALLARSDLPDQPREALHAALGRYFDQQAEYEAAFDNFQKANVLRRATLTYDSDTHEVEVDRLIERYDAAWFRSRPPASDDPTIVFLVGMPRSGSTLVHQILASHADVRGIGESGFAEKLIRQKWGQNPESETYGSNWSDAELDTFRQDFMAMLPVDVRGANFIIDKSLNNIYHLGPILRAFANVRVVHCCRDARDTILSCYFSSFPDTLAYSFDLDDLKRRQKSQDRLSAHWRSVLGDRFQDVHYEELVGQPEAQTRQLLEHAGLEWDPACLTFHTGGENVVTSSIYQVRQPVYASSVGRWKNYQSQLEAVLEV